MSVLKGIKGTFQSVQQDIVDGIKAMTSFEGQPNRETLQRLRGDGVKLDAGADLLYRYHLSWREIDSYTKESAKRAEGLDVNIYKIYNEWKKQSDTITHLEESVRQLPDLELILNTLTTSIGSLQEDFHHVEEALEKLEDVCDEQEMVKQREMHKHQLQQYKQTKAKDIEKVKVQMARDHASRMQDIEKSRSEKLQERHEAFNEAFTSDLSFYKQHGRADTLSLSEISKVSSLSDICIDQDDQALNDFLTSQTTTPIGDNPVDVQIAVGEKDDDDDNSNNDTHSEDVGQLQLNNNNLPNIEKPHSDPQIVDETINSDNNTSNSSEIHQSNKTPNDRNKYENISNTQLDQTTSPQIVDDENQIEFDQVEDRIDTEVSTPDIPKNLDAKNGTTSK